MCVRLGLCVRLYMYTVCICAVIFLPKGQLPALKWAEALMRTTKPTLHCMRVHAFSEVLSQHLPATPSVFSPIDVITEHGGSAKGSPSDC